jgi:hypothetical protein
MADEETCDVWSTLAPLAVGHTMMYGYEFFEKYKTFV